MKIREILEDNIERGSYYPNELPSLIHKAIVEGMPKEIEARQIENNPNFLLLEDIGYNQYRTEMLKVLDKLFKENK